MPGVRASHQTRAKHRETQQGTVRNQDTVPALSGGRTHTVVTGVLSALWGQGLPRGFKEGFPKEMTCEMEKSQGKGDPRADGEPGGKVSLVSWGNKQGCEGKGRRRVRGFRGQGHWS